MQNEHLIRQERGYGRGNGRSDWQILGTYVSRKTMIGLIMATALIAFEAFNYDTTRYALQDFLGSVSFMGVTWASILAIAFCAIDFAGLARLFTPEQGEAEQKAIWYLMGAWLLGATLNAAMTWWAVSLTLLNHSFGNEVLSREQLLQIVPIFVAALVWLTRILFIGAFSVAGEHLFEPVQPAQRPSMQPTASVGQRPLRQPTPPPTPEPTALPPTPVRRSPVPNRPQYNPAAMYAKGKE
ncbi:MAG: hypothetical protein H6658_01155 [Ardenticatenaceae bacterium]|nr:hypothetical protein [Ardenticatenaceae bacterium]